MTYKIPTEPETYIVVRGHPVIFDSNLTQAETFAARMAEATGDEYTILKVPVEAVTKASVSVTPGLRGSDLRRCSRVA